MNIQETSILTWSTEEQNNIDNMSIDTLCLIMDREDQCNKGHLENEYLDIEGEL